MPETVMRNDRIRRFCQSFILECEEKSFDFDASQITRINLHESIAVISRQLFCLRPVSESYVKALLIFAADLHKKLQHESWYHIDLLVQAVADPLERVNYDPPMSIVDELNTIINCTIEYLY